MAVSGFNSHLVLMPVGKANPTIAVDDKARLPPSGKYLGARSTRCIRATVKQYARLAWVYLWSLLRVIGLYPPANVGWRGRSCRDFIPKTTIAVPPKENQTAAMLKSRLKAD